MLSLNLEQIYASDRTIMVDQQQYLREYVCEQLGTPEPFTSAYWFHGTRTFAGNAFPDGLLDLGQSEKLIMKTLIDLAPDRSVRNKLQAWNTHAGVPDELFQLRTQDKIHWGPFGHLVREVHSHAQDLRQHDYTRLPELVEDVCNAFKEAYDQDLTAHYLQALQPCIVKFIADIEYNIGAVEAALAYAYTSVRNLPPDGGALYGIDRGGISIPRDSIIKIDFLDAG